MASCAICAKPYDGQRSPRMLPCAHIFCSSCLQARIKSTNTHDDLLALSCPTCCQTFSVAKPSQSISTGNNVTDTRNFPSALEEIYTCLKVAESSSAQQRATINPHISTSTVNSSHLAAQAYSRLEDIEKIVNRLSRELALIESRCADTEEKIDEHFDQLEVDIRYRREELTLLAKSIASDKRQKLVDHMERLRKLEFCISALTSDSSVFVDVKEAQQMVHTLLRSKGIELEVTRPATKSKFSFSADEAVAVAVRRHGAVSDTSVAVARPAAIALAKLPAVPELPDESDNCLTDTSLNASQMDLQPVLSGDSSASTTCSQDDAKIYTISVFFQCSLLFGGNCELHTGHRTYPFGIACLRDGRIVVTEFGSHCVCVLSRDGKKSSIISAEGKQPGLLCCPRGVAVDSQDRIYVVDQGNHRIQVFDADGIFVRGWGVQGSTRGLFKNPWGVAVSKDELVFVADTYNQRIQVFSSKGDFIREFSAVDMSKSDTYTSEADNSTCSNMPTSSNLFRLCKPTGVAVSPVSGHLFVTDFQQHRIVVFTPDGKTVRMFGSHGSSTAQFCNPASVCINHSGHVFVSEYNGCRIQAFDEQGSYLGCWGEKSSIDRREKLAFPYGVCIRNHNLLVADQLHHRICALKVKVAVQ